jgi:predicted DNA-binding protein
MGGQNSKPSEEQIEEPIEKTVEDNNDFKVDEFYNKIDDIATNYILTMDFKSLKKLSEKEYCDKLVLMTSEIFENRLNSMEVKYLL